MDNFILLRWRKHGATTAEQLVRPAYGQSAWDGKPGAIISVSPGAIGGFGANHHLRQSLVFLNVPAMTQPEAYIGNASKLFDDNGAISNNDTRDFMQKFLLAFEAWIDRY